ncbi:MAG: hypothetical protein EOP11_16625, partial [Proteobacteria bacterium]
MNSALRKISATLIIGLFSLPPAARADFVVGNHADVIIEDGRYSLLDLFESGLHRGPYVGARLDPDMPSLPPSLLGLEEEVRGLILRKLADINSLFPGLGDVLLASSKFYVWRLVDGPAAKMPDFEGSPVVQAAKRDGLTILIRHSVWRELDVANKAALIIHEMISIKMQPQSYNGMFQSQRNIKELTTQFFDSHTFAGSAPSLKTLWESRLGLPPRMQTAGLRHLPKLSFSVRAARHQRRWTVEAGPASPADFGTWAQT